MGACECERAGVGRVRTGPKAARDLHMHAGSGREERKSGGHADRAGASNEGETHARARARTRARRLTRHPSPLAPRPRIKPHTTPPRSHPHHPATLTHLAQCRVVAKAGAGRVTAALPVGDVVGEPVNVPAPRRRVAGRLGHRHVGPIVTRRGGVGRDDEAAAGGVEDGARVPEIEAIVPEDRFQGKGARYDGARGRVPRRQEAVIDLDGRKGWAEGDRYVRSLLKIG